MAKLVFFRAALWSMMSLQTQTVQPARSFQKESHPQNRLLKYLVKSKWLRSHFEEPLLVVMPASDITDEMRTLAETYADKLAKTQRERNNEYKLVQSKAT